MQPQPLIAIGAEVNGAPVTLVEQERPLVCFDFETTGPDKNRDRVIQFSFRKVNLTTGDVVHLEGFVNPEMPVSESAQAVHGISDAQLSLCEPFRAYAERIVALLEGCDLLGYHILSYDLPILVRELQLAGIFWDYTQHRVIDVAGLYKQLHPRTLGAAYREYIGGELFDAHDADADTKATLQVFMAMLSRHGELPQDRNALALYSNYGKPIVDLSGRFTVNEAGEVVFAFGQHAGKVAKGEPSYLGWMLAGNFPEDTKAICRKLLARDLQPANNFTREATDRESITTTR